MLRFRDQETISSANPLQPSGTEVSMIGLIARKLCEWEGGGGDIETYIDP